MNIVRNVILGVVALAGFAIATPAQAYDHYYHGYHHYYHSGPRFAVTFGTPYYYSYRPYYYSYDPYYYDYYRPYYGYSYGPGISFAFGGHHGYYYHNYHHSYHHHH
jgi:hypothetical protein